MSEKILKKKAVPTGVEADIDEHAIIVHYEMVVIYGDPEGNVIRTQKVPQKKNIKLGNFQKDDINDIADELIRSCNLINPQRRDILLKALQSLITGEKSSTLAGDASLDKLDEYVDAMYDDLQVKIESTGKILQLCQQKQNLPHIAHNNVLMAALSRVLRDDGLKSIELGTNIAHSFYIISHFQNYGYPLLEQKAPESLFKMIDQENKRYQTFYNKLAEMRGKVQQSGSAQDKQAYQRDYEKFKKLVTTQDKMLFVALQTVINLTEINEIRTGKTDLFYQMDRLAKLLSQVLQRKPPNSQLVLTSLNYLKRLSVLPGGIELIHNTGVIKTLMKLFDQDEELFEPIVKLLYNLAFDPRVRQELAESEIFSKLDEMFLELNNELLEKYKSEYDENAPLQEKLAAIIKNHNGRAEDDEIKAIMKRASQVSKFIMLMADDEQGMKGFAKTNIGSNLTAFTCMCKSQEPEVMKTLQQLAIDSRIAAKIAKNNLLNGLTDQFTRTKDQTYMKLFTGLAGAIPQDQRIGQQTATKGGHAGVSGATTQQLYENAAKIADIAIESGDKQLEKQALQLIAQAPAKHVQKEQAQKITKMAINALDPSEKDIDKKISAVGVVAMMMSRANHVQQMCDNGDLKKLPDQLLDVFKEGLGRTNMKAGEIGLDFQTCEYDLLITVLVSILKACSYKVLRKEFLQRAQFLPFVVRMMYNQPRPGSDDVGFRAAGAEEDTEEEATSKSRGRRDGAPERKAVPSQGNEDRRQKGALRPLLIRSRMKGVEKRALHVLEALADLILDVLMFSEPSAAEQVRQLKFQRYHFDFYTKVLK